MLDFSPSRRRLLLSLGGAALVARTAVAHSSPLPAAPVDGTLTLSDTQPIWRIGFGSCGKADRPQPIWKAVASQSPHLFLFLGDNFYVDTRDPARMELQHEAFRRHQDVQQFLAHTPHVAIWDDHDYGEDDAGREYPLKRESQAAFCRTWNLPEASARCSREGLYGAHWLRSAGRSVQVLLLDVRYHRSPLVRHPEAVDYAQWLRRAWNGTTAQGWYLPNPDPSATLLGETQWQWLQRQLDEPADLRILATPIQLAAEGTGWECWAHFPFERQRLAQLLSQRRGGGVLAISGDMHYGEVSRWPLWETAPNGPKEVLWDITSSGITETWTIPTPNHRRMVGPYTGRHFGMLELDWSRRRWKATIRDESGGTRLSHESPFHSIEAA